MTARRKANGDAAPVVGAHETISKSATPLEPEVTKAPTPTVDAWAIPLKAIYENESLRLDATHYDRDAALALVALEASGFPLRPLSELADLVLPSMFTRVWASSSAFGRRYVNSTDLMGLFAIGESGAAPRYLSNATKVNVDGLVLRTGWLLVTCSGTIGRVFYVSERMEGWVATHDLIRVIPKEPGLAGYLLSYLNCSVAQAQMLGHTHGGQIDHITDRQLGSVLVPMLPDETIAAVHQQAIDACQQRENAMNALLGASTRLAAHIHQ